MSCAAWRARVRTSRCPRHEFARSSGSSTNACRPPAAGAELDWLLSLVVVWRCLLISFSALALAAWIVLDPISAAAGPPETTLLVTFQAAASQAADEALLQSV